jgi:hypothetical protein
MKCIDETIKDSLPAYQQKMLDQAEQERVRKHLEGCEDCRTELSLLRMMSEEPVPDPGGAFWATMPDRVFRGVTEAKNAKRGPFDLSWLWRRLLLPRWAWAAAAVGIVLMVSWLALRTPQKAPEPSLSQSTDFSEEIMFAVSPDSDTIQLSELDQQELNAMDDWTGKELASIAEDVGQAEVTTAEMDISEELAELNAAEMERLSTMLTERQEEG